MLRRQTDDGADDDHRRSPSGADLASMMLTSLICLGASVGAGYLVLRVHWHLLVRVYVGANGAFFALLGVIALAKAVQQLGSPRAGKSSSSR
jgi:hypothetical protein